MKKVASLLILLAAALTLFDACKPEQDLTPKKGNAIFSLSQKARNTSGRTEEIAVPAAVLLSIKDVSGTFLHENKKLALYGLGQGYVSESLELPAGKYSLTQFAILDVAGKIIYATPLEGSDLAHYVNDPLPVEFTITENESTKLVPQVLPVLEEDKPESFGYASFGFEVVSLEKYLTINFIFNSAIKYNSISVAFSNGSFITKKKFQQKEGVAKVKIPWSELSGNGICKCFNMTLSAFYDGIASTMNDGFEYTEKRVIAPLQLTNLDSEITVNSTEQSTSFYTNTNSNPIIAKQTNYAHNMLKDVFHFELNADTPTDPHFYYQLKQNSYDVLFDRGLFNYQSGSMPGVAYWSSNPPGPFITNQWIDGSSDFSGAAQFSQNKDWNFADAVCYAVLENGDAVAWYYSWDKTATNNGREKRSTLAVTKYSDLKALLQKRKEILRQ